MLEPDADHPDREVQSPVRSFIGVCLILPGVGVAGWLVVSIMLMIASGEVPGLVAAMMPQQGPVALDVPGGKVTLPEEVFKPIGYVIVCIAYAIVAGVAGTLINGGTSLLQPDVGKLLRRLLERLDRK